MYFDKNKINFSFYSTEKLEIVCEMILKSSKKTYSQSMFYITIFPMFNFCWKLTRLAGLYRYALV